MDEKALVFTAETQLKKFGLFLDDHNRRLNTLLEKNDTSTKGEILDNLFVDINYSQDRERLSLIKLLDSDRELHKIVLTFGYCCIEIRQLLRDAKKKQMQILYFDEDLLTVVDDNTNSKSNESKGNFNINQKILHKMSFSIEFLYNVLFLIQRSTVCGSHVLHQCGAVAGNEAQQFQIFDVIDHLVELLTCLVVFDEIFENTNYRVYWPLYTRTIEALSHNKKKSEGYSTAEMNGLQNSLKQLDFLFSSNVFQNFLESIFSLKDLIGAKSMGNLTQHFNAYLKYHLALMDKSSHLEVEFSYTRQHPLVRLNVFCVMFHNFCGQVDSRCVKHLLELNARHQGIGLIGTILWSPPKFLRKHAETLIKHHEKLVQDAKRQSDNFTVVGVNILQRECRFHCLQVAEWSLKASKVLSNTNATSVDEFKTLMALLLSGLHNAGKISFLVRGVINAHVAQQTPMPKQALLAICKLIESLKIIQDTYQKHTQAIARVIQNILQFLQYKILTLFTNYRKKLMATKLNDKNVDALAAIKIAEKCMTGPCSESRILITKLAINATKAVMPVDYQNKFQSILERIEILTSFQNNFKEICDTSFIYWHQSILVTYMKQIVERRVDFNSLQHIICSANSSGTKLDQLQLGDLEISHSLRKSNYENLRSEVIIKLCAHVETYLRLEKHANLQLDKINPFNQAINDYRDLINTCPLEINGQYVVLKHHIENYLSSMFYNLTTISLHDWKTYEEMSQIAYNRLHLKPIDGYLPNQTLEQGIDILEIMRKIHIFVSKYVYNMNSQVFVEQQSANKHLDTIGIRHVANSLRTHGIGVINTTVNFAYQFLRQKFFTFSQFLYDEQIKSRLLKELRSYAERKQNETLPLYPFERAEAFNKDIRKLGLSSDGQTYMDLFRKVITHVGNTMAYIRLVRSGSLHANYSASLFLPNFEQNFEFAEKCRKSSLHETTIAAAENLECSIKNLCESFSDSKNYFKLLVDAFKPLFQNPQNVHLKNFFLIVPPLTLNFVEHILASKAKINKKDHDETILFDDGFAIGLAYILKLLDQYGHFNALQWFNTVRERFDAEQHKVKEMLAAISTSKMTTKISAAQKIENEKLQQTLALTERRIVTHQTEFNLLFYNISSAKIFFQ